jgi:hypothetical protein
MSTNSFGTISGYVPLFNISSDNSDFTTTNNLTVNNSVNLPFLNANQLVRTDASKNLVSATLTGTANQVIVTDNSTNYTLSLPQSIATNSTPTFNDITLTNLIANQLLFAVIRTSRT